MIRLHLSKNPNSEQQPVIVGKRQVDAWRYGKPQDAAFRPPVIHAGRRPVSNLKILSAGS